MSVQKGKETNGFSNCALRQCKEPNICPISIFVRHTQRPSRRWAANQTKTALGSILKTRRKRSEASLRQVLLE